MTAIRYISAIMALCLAAGCVDKSYTGIINEMTAGDEDLPVHIVVGDPGDIVEAKGTGAMEDGDAAVWEGKTINVFAFKRSLDSDYSTLSASGHEDCLIDGSCDRGGHLGGKEAGVNPSDSYIRWTGDEETVYYKPGNQPYDFFAYYTDGPVADSKISRSKEDVRIMIDIDGCSDIMSAYASLTEDQLSRPGFSDIDKLDLNTYSFSAWSAKRNIHPVFYFNHHLTRFDFVIKAGRESAETIIIDSLVIKAKDKAIFTVAHKNPSRLGLDFSGSDYGRIPLSEADGTPLRKDFWKPEFTQEGVEMKPLGGSLMVAPDIKYDAYLYLKEHMENGEIKTHENHMNITCSEGRFDAGSQYLVKATIFGLTSVDITVNLAEWEEGGSIDIGSDKFEDE